VTTQQALRLIVKPLVFVAALGPVAWLTWAGLTGNISVNPLSDLTNETGVWALRFLCISIAITPLRRLTGWSHLIRFRRMTGLFAFFYGTLHFLTYVIADRFASLVDFPDGIVSWTTARNLVAAIGEDVAKRPYITVGFSAFVLMLPLAITSTSGWIRRLGGKRWATVHRLIYLTGIGAVVHYWWLVKADIRRPLAYGVVVGVLLAFRFYWARVRSVVPQPSRVAAAARASHSAPRP